MHNILIITIMVIMLQGLNSGMFYVFFQCLHCSLTHDFPGVFRQEIKKSLQANKPHQYQLCQLSLERYNHDLCVQLYIRAIFLQCSCYIQPIIHHRQLIVQMNAFIKLFIIALLIIPYTYLFKSNVSSQQMTYNP